jgi:hypothetical protein
MKKILLLTTAFYFIVTLHAQSRRTEVKNSHDKYANQEVPYLTTTKLPEGTGFKNGNIVLKTGYRASYADNAQIIVVYRKNGSVSGSFTCYCNQTGSCTPKMEYGAVVCRPIDCIDCRISVVVNPPKNATLTKGSLKWKVLVLQNPTPEDPDQGGEIIKKKDLPVKQ